MGGVILSLVVAALLIERLGFTLTMLAIFLFLFRVLGGYSLVITVVSALIGSFGIYHVFHHWLHVTLPAGLLGL